MESQESLLKLKLLKEPGYSNGLNHMLQLFKTKLSKKTKLTSSVFLFHFDILGNKRLNFKAGQYVILKIKGKTRLYSIASSQDKKDNFELIIELIPNGIGSTYFKNLKVGDISEFQAQAGVFTLRKNNENIIFLVTGTGIVPIRSMLKSFKYSKQIYLFWGLKTLKDIYLFNEFKKIQKENKNFHFKICLSREKNLLKINNEDKQYFSIGRVSGELNKLNNLNNFCFYLCGGAIVVESLKQELIKKGINESKIISEKY